MKSAGPGAEQIALGVDFHAIRHARLVALQDGPDFAARYAVFPYLEPADVHLRGVVDEENRSLLSETQTVWLFEILDKSDDRAVPRINTIDAPIGLLFLARDSHTKQHAFARVATIGRVGEIETP